MMIAINSQTQFTRLSGTRSRYKKVLAVVLFVMALFATRAFAEEKPGMGMAYSLTALRAESILGLYFFDFKLPSVKSNSGGLNLLDWNSDLTLIRPFEALRVDLFRAGNRKFSKFEPGIGTYFPDDTIGRSRTSGAGLEENRWIFFKFKFRF